MIYASVDKSIYYGIVTEEMNKTPWQNNFSAITEMESQNDLAWPGYNLVNLYLFASIPFNLRQWKLKSKDNCSGMHVVRCS